jgi:hypothetical protein
MRDPRRWFFQFSEARPWPQFFKFRSAAVAAIF